MGRIANILTRVRDSLGDPSATRWSNDRLLRLLDEAQNDIAVHADLLRSRAEISIFNDISTYSLPAEALKLTRVLGTDKATLASDTTAERRPIPVKTHSQMDELDLYWEDNTSDGIEAVVFDKLDAKQFKVYPIPTVDDAATAYSVAPDLGVLITAAGDTVPSPYGMLTDVTTTASLTATFSSAFGVVTDMSSALTSLIVYYNRRPTVLDDYSKIDIDQVLEIDEIFDRALKHYVIGMALRDDMDTQNRTVGNEELVFYERERKLASQVSSVDNTTVLQQTINYNDGFNV